MRLFSLTAAIAGATLLATSACTPKPKDGSAAANADAVADQLEAKANNYSMLADNSVDTEAVIALDNASGSLGEQSANVRAAANPRETMK